MNKRKTVVLALAVAAATAAAVSPATAGPTEVNVLLGATIAFQSYRDGNGEIYAMRADGSYETNITKDPAEDAWPAASRDGKKLAFTRLKPKQAWELYTVNPDGSAQFHVNKAAQGQSFEVLHPSFTPDGSAILFSAQNSVDGTYIRSIGANGSGFKTLQVAPAAENLHAEAGAGGRLVFASDYWGTQRGILTSNLDGSGLTDLSPGETYDSHPTWSPDGSRIAFASGRDGDADIYVMNADGSNVTQLTFDPAVDSEPAWSPDGKKIAFSSTRTGNLDIFVMDASGSNVVQLTSDAAHDSYPTWVPLYVWLKLADQVSVPHVANKIISNLPKPRDLPPPLPPLGRRIPAPDPDEPVRRG